ncbi:MAG: conjugal transfer protein, partial [Acidimicrobiales bacterium]
TPREVLAGVLANTGAETSAHETLRRAQHDTESWASLHAEYQTIAQAAQAERWNTLLDHSGLTDQQLQQVRSSVAHGPLLTAFRDADSRGLDLESSLPRLVRTRTFADADDPASVLHERVERWIHVSCSRRQPRTNLIAGLIPRALAVTDPDYAHALNERDKALEHRARMLAEKAVIDRVGWLRQLGSPPVDPRLRVHWMRAISTVAAYRERWNITADDQALGPASRIGGLDQAKQRRQALAAAEQARRLSSTTPRGQDPGLAVNAPTASREGIDI